MIPRDPGPSDPVDPSTDAADRSVRPEPADPTDPRPPPAPPARPGAGTFTIEGRAAPALFVVGWLATLVGIGAIVVALLAGGSAGAAILLTAGLAILSIGLVAGAGAQGIERRTRARGAYAGPSPFLVFAATVPVSLLAVIAIGIPLTLAGIAVDGPFGRLASVAAQAVVYIGLIRLLVVDTGALTWLDMGVRSFDREALGQFASGALWAGPVIGVTYVVAAVLYLLFPVTPVSPLPPAGESVGFAINLVAGAVVAPIGEEFMFRAFATTAWARSLGERRGLVRAALFFAVVHVLSVSGASAGEAISLAIVGFASRVPVALALGWLFLRRRTIWASIGLHATFNLILLIVGEVAARSGLGPA
ncbi:MAG: protease family protein [Chloroflexota bacterium]|nr:protease family protein [Chloroflexota bacterium]